jgi:hypothetical protein
MYMSLQSDHDTFRVLLYRNQATELLLEEAENSLRIPTVTIPGHSRVAEQITAAVEERWNLVTCCLFSFPNLGNANASTCCQVAEVCHSDPGPPAGMHWLPVNSLSISQFTEPVDFAAIQHSQEALDHYWRADLPGAFGKPGWIRDVTEWVAECAMAAGLRLTRKFCQFNASATFSLLRFDTDGPALWFKAVGESNVREYAITLHLSHLLSGYVPRMIASNSKWNAWLSLEAEGQHLSDTSSSEEWQNVAATLADLQIASFGNGLHLIDSGCRDLRAYLLLEQVDPFFDCMAELMGNQAKPTPAPLTRPELAILSAAVREAVEELLESEIPNVLGHLDCNPGNILVSQKRCIFLDWAEGCVGHPFFTFEYLREHWRRFHGTDSQYEQSLVSSYARHWSCLASPEEIATNLRLVPLLAAFTYAAGSVDWRNLERIRPETAGYLRSLTRRMQREAAVLQQERPTCVP